MSGVQSRTSMRILKVQLVLWLVLAGAAGCGSGEPLHVTTLQLGRALNADNTVAAFTTRFAPHDTVYLAVVTAGAGSGTISVRWTYFGHVIDEPKRKVSYQDIAATEFHLKTAAALPPGDYIVEAFLEGQSVGTRPFQVSKAE
jgi:hypothetical protein